MSQALKLGLRHLGVLGFIAVEFDLYLFGLINNILLNFTIIGFAPILAVASALATN
jgi:hypothetical protein